MQMAGTTPQHAQYQLNQQMEAIKNIHAPAPYSAPNQVDFTIYLPSALDAPLGLATDTDFTGYKYYLPNPNTQLNCIHPREFWDLYVQSFIHNIRQNGTKN